MENLNRILYLLLAHDRTFYGKNYFAPVHGNVPFVVANVGIDLTTRGGAEHRGIPKRIIRFAIVLFSELDKIAFR